MRNVRGSQPYVSINCCTEFSKVQVLPFEYRQQPNVRALVLAIVEHSLITFENIT